MGRSTRLGDPADDYGRYRVLSLLGEGPRSAVYLAQDATRGTAKVALRVMKRGDRAKEVIARFDAQRDALMTLTHANVAGVLDRGVSRAGLPYFVAEYVDGVPITVHCDRHRMPLRERVELLVPVCHATQHAHQNGLIHGDLNPSRVLVTQLDGEVRPRIIDFGIAGVVEPRLTESNPRAPTGRPSAMPAYMSPEQADLTGLEIDARTDLYSLGVMLYEVLVGVLPFRDEQLVGVEALYSVLERAPPTIAERFDGLGDRRTIIADRRATDPARLAKQLAGDLERIVERAMEKDRSRRYQTANRLALDLGRYVAHQPLPAHPLRRNETRRPPA